MQSYLVLLLILPVFYYGCEEDNKNLRVFEDVHSLVENEFFDANYNGIDWKNMKNKYKPIVENCKSNDELFTALNHMLFELNCSHLGIGLLSELESNSSPYLFAKGEIGVDIRIIEEQMVITKVAEGSPASLAKLRVGNIIKEINGLNLEDISKKSIYKPPFNQRNKKFHLTTTVMKMLYGEPNTTLKLKFVNVNNAVDSICLLREKRKNGVEIGHGLPEALLKSESYFINKNIAYLSFNAFQPSSLNHVLSKLDALKNSKGLIIDLRGNDGGSVEAMKLLLGKFISKKTIYGTYRNSSQSHKDHVLPSPPIYAGNLVVLIDELSISGAENFAGIIKLLNVGIVVGNQTPGQMLWSNGYLLGDSIAMVLPIYKLNYTNGFNPENNGITPNFKIPLNMEDLKKGKDSQLEFAIKYLNDKPLNHKF